MAKKKESIYQSWDEVNEAMKELGELQVKKQKLEGEQTVKINEIKKDYQEKAGNLTTKIKEIEKDIERFAEQNKTEFLKTRNKKLNFGTISYRLTKRIVVGCVEGAINALKSLNLDYYLRQKCELDKEKLYECDEKTLSKVGIKIVTEDKINIEPAYVKLMAMESEV